MVCNLQQLEDTLDDGILELQDFGDDLYNQSQEFRSKADRLYEIEKKFVASLDYVKALRDNIKASYQTDGGNQWHDQTLKQ